MRLRTACFVCIVCVVLLAAPASAGVLYDNGAIDGTVNAWSINSGYAVTDSFTLPTDSTVTGVNFGAWVDAGDTPLNVDWMISTSNAFDGSTALASGTATLANVLQIAGTLGLYDVYRSSFSTGSVPLGAGTYWLLLQNAVTAQGSEMYWDENGGPSLAFQNGPLLQRARTSESFQILGETGTATPEPGSLALLGSGVLVLAVALRRKLSR